MTTEKQSMNSSTDFDRSSPIHVAIAGFGLSTRIFHLPFLLHDPRFVVTKIFERTTNYAKEYSNDIETVREFSQLLGDEIDLVIICTPNQTHFEFAKQALLAGKHVIVEKPVCTNVTQLEELTALSQQNNCLFSIYQNRRWDSGFATVKKILKERLVGEPLDYIVRMDRYTKEKNKKLWKESGELGSGLVYDLGVHLIDHAVDLFKMPEAIYADIRYQHEGVVSDDSFKIQLYYGELLVTLQAGKFVREPEAHIALHGKLGSYIKQVGDKQERLLNEGVNIFPGWQHETEEEWGLLNSEINGEHFRGKLASEEVSYSEYYANIAEVLAGKERLIVTPQQARDVLYLIEKAFESAELGEKLRYNYYLESVYFDKSLGFNQAFYLVSIR